MKSNETLPLPADMTRLLIRATGTYAYYKFTILECAIEWVQSLVSDGYEVSLRKYYIGYRLKVRKEKVEE